MEEQVIVNKRFAYRIADMLPRPLRIIYYMILWLTLIYLMIRVTALILKYTQKLGAMIFDEKHFYFLVFVSLFLFVIIVLVAQFYFGLDPIGNFWDWVGDKIQQLKDYIIENIIAKLRNL